MSKQSFKYIKAKINNFIGKSKASLKPHIKWRVEAAVNLTVCSVRMTEEVDKGRSETSL